MKIHTLVRKFVLGLSVLAAGLQVQATPIASYSDIYATFFSTGPYKFNYGITENFVPGTLNIDAKILEISGFTNAVWGTTYTLNAGNTATFAAFTGMLTDGEEDRFTRIIETGGGLGGGSRTESDTLFGDPSGALGVDLIGYNITEITIQFAEDHTFDFLSPQIQGKYTVTFFGSVADVSVPDVGPGLGLFGATLGVLLVVHRRRCGHPART